MAKGKQRDGRLETRWRGILSEQERSGLGVRAFCRGKGVRETAFYYWRRELQRRQAEHEQRRVDAPPSAPMFVPVHLAEHDTPSSPIEIVLSSGCRVHLTGPVDRQALVDVLTALHSAAAIAAPEVRRC
jgi:transposase-like protein